MGMSDIPDEVDFSHGVRGKYAARIAGRPLSTPTTRGEAPPAEPICLDDDLLDEFPDSDAVNHALREYRRLRDSRHAG